MARTLIVFAVVSCLVLSAFAGKEKGSDGKGDGKGDDASGAPHKESRKISLKVSNGGVNFDSVSKVDGEMNKMQFDLKAPGNSPMRFRLKYFTHSADTNTLVNLHMAPLSLIEFNDTDGDDEFNPNDDKIVSEVVFARGGWVLPSKLSDIESVTDADGNVRYAFVASYEDGLFAIIVHMADAAYTINGTQYQPSTVKLDFLASDFPYQRENETLLALKVHLQAAALGESQFPNGKVETGDDGAVSFSWASDVLLDGVAGRVKTTGPFDAAADEAEGKGEKARQIYFTFAGKKSPKEVNWDPTLSMEAGAASILASLSLLLAALLAHLF